MREKQKIIELQYEYMNRVKVYVSFLRNGNKDQVVSESVEVSFF